MKKHKVELNAQTIWLGEHPECNSLATTLQFLKSWGIRLPYQFANLSSSDKVALKSETLASFLLRSNGLGQTFDLEKYCEDLARKRLFNLLALIQNEMGLASKWSQSFYNLDAQTQYLARICKTLLSTDHHYLILEVSEKDIPRELAPALLGALSEHIKGRGTTLFLATDDIDTWGATTDYQLARCQVGRFTLEAYAHEEARLLPFTYQARTEQIDEAQALSNPKQKDHYAHQGLKKLG